MKKVVIFELPDIPESTLHAKCKKTEGIELSAFVRNPQKFSDMDMTGVNIIQGDALNEEDVLRAMGGQDILFCSLEGDVLTMAKNYCSCIG